MERVTFLLEDTGERISAMLNPETVVMRRLAGIGTRRGALGRIVGAQLPDDPLVRTGGGRTELELELLFDVGLAGSTTAATDVLSLTEPFRALAENPYPWSSAPNFAFDLAARKTTDDDLAGLDLGDVLGIISGAERVEPATLQRFVDRFAHFKFRDDMMRPSYGLAEATVFVATGKWSEASPATHFDSEALGAGRVAPCAGGQLRGAPAEQKGRGEAWASFLRSSSPP